MVLSSFLKSYVYIWSDTGKLNSGIWFRIQSVRVFSFTVAKSENAFLHKYALAECCQEFHQANRRLIVGLNTDSIRLHFLKKRK